MSKMIAALPHLRVKDSVIGGLIALAGYTLLQFLSALLVHRQIFGAEMIYPMVCISAALASFLGCGYSVLRSGKGNMLSAAAVIVVFLFLTVAVGILSNEAHTVGAGLTGVGGSMAAGGLVAAVAGSLTANRGRVRREMPGSRKKKK